MREKLLEQKLVKAVKAAGGIALKFTSPGFDGVPDRLILFPYGRIAFAEVKMHGVNSRPLQIRRHEMLRQLGFMVFVIDDEFQITWIISKIIGGDAK